MSSNFIYRLRNKHLGDNWATIGFLLSLSQQWSTPVYVERKAIAYGGEVWNPEALTRRIVQLFDSTGTILFTDSPGDPIDEAFVKTAWRMTYPTKQPWKGGSHVCIQFGGSWMADRKNIPENDARVLVRELLASGYEILPLGLPMTIEEAVRLLAGCRFFIGIDSGFMHIAHSVGCPRYLIRNSMPWIEDVHRGREWFGCANARECLEHIQNSRFPKPGIFSSSLSNPSIRLSL